MVVVGTTNRILGGDTYFLDQIISHEDYDAAAITNDVSLLKVKSDIKFSDLVQPIALPTEDTEAGADLFLSGWGRISVSTFSGFLLLFSLPEPCKNCFPTLPKSR